MEEKNRKQKSRTRRLWSFLVKNSSFLLVLGLIIVGWLLFILLVGVPPMDTTPALIMVWASILILILAAYPKLLERIRRIKFRDFEIELKEEVEASSRNILISENEIPGQYLLFEKSDFGRLGDLIKLAKINPDKSILLTVDLNKRILIPFLYIYVILLNAMGSSVLVLFIARNKGLTKAIGVTTGNTLIRVFTTRFQELFNIYSSTIFREILRGHEYHNDLEGSWSDFYMTQEFASPQYQLSENNVLSWFAGNLSNTTVSIEFDENDIKKIRRALERNEQYLILLDHGKYSVISLCDIGIIITRKALNML